MNNDDIYATPFAPQRAEVVTVELRAPRLPRPISIVASTQASIEFTVRADGVLVNLGSMNTYLVLSDGEGHAMRFDGVSRRRGSAVFNIDALSITSPCDLVYQLIGVYKGPGGEAQEWARGSLHVLDNPSADYTPIVWPEPPFIPKDALADYLTVDPTTMTMELQPNGKYLLKVIGGGSSGSGIEETVARKLKTDVESARWFNELRMALVDFANAFIPSTPTDNE